VKFIVRAVGVKSAVLHQMCKFQLALLQLDLDQMGISFRQQAWKQAHRADGDH
jgi:lipase chaperone LimK